MRSLEEHQRDLAKELTKQAEDGGQADPAYTYALNLAMAIYRDEYADKAPDWKPLPDLLGLLTQIDNMVAAGARAQPAEQGEPVCTVHHGGLGGRWGKGTFVVRWEPGAAFLADGEHKLYAIRDAQGQAAQPKDDFPDDCEV